MVKTSVSSTSSQNYGCQKMGVGVGGGLDCGSLAPEQQMGGYLIRALKKYALLKYLAGIWYTGKGNRIYIYKIF